MLDTEVKVVGEACEFQRMIDIRRGCQRNETIRTNFAVGVMSVSPARK
jgi:hypothetical protein